MLETGILPKKLLAMKVSRTVLLKKAKHSIKKGQRAKP